MLEKCVDKTFGDFCANLDTSKNYRFGFSNYPQGLELEQKAWTIEDVPGIEKLAPLDISIEQMSELLKSTEKGLYGFYIRTKGNNPNYIKTTFTHDFLQILLAENNTPATIREFGVDPLKWIAVLAWTIKGYPEAIEKYYPEARKHIDNLNKIINHLLKTKEDPNINQMILRRTNMESPNKIKKIVLESPENVHYLYSLIAS